MVPIQFVSGYFLPAVIHFLCYAESRARKALLKTFSPAHYSRNMRDDTDARLASYASSVGTRISGHLRLHIMLAGHSLCRHFIYHRSDTRQGRFPFGDTTRTTRRDAQKSTIISHLF